MAERVCLVASPCFEVRSVECLVARPGGVTVVNFVRYLGGGASRELRQLVGAFVKIVLQTVSGGTE